MTTLLSLFGIEKTETRFSISTKENEITGKLARWIMLSVALGFIHFVVQIAALVNTCLMILVWSDARKLLFKYKMAYPTFIFLITTCVVAVVRGNWVGLGASFLFGAMFMVFFVARAILTKSMVENALSYIVMFSNVAALVAVIEKIYFIIIGKGSHRCFSVSINPNFYGLMTVLAVLFCIYKIVNVDKKRGAFIVSAIMNVIGLILCGSVSLWVVMALMVGGYLLFGKQYKYLVIFCAVAIFVGAVVALMPQIMPRLVKVFADDGTANSRLLIYERTINTLEKYPFFGRGFLSYRMWRIDNPAYYSEGIKNVNLAHNIVLDSLLSHGVVGTALIGSAFVAFLVSVLNTVKRVWSGRVQSYSFPLLGAVLLGIAPYSMIDTTYIWCQAGMIILFVFAFVGVDERVEIPDEEPKETKQTVNV